MGTRKWVAAIAGVVLVGAIGVGAVMAQSDEEGSRLSFLDRVAQKLGIERGTLDQAFKDARSDEIDERVAEGDLTQEQADALKKRFEEFPADAPFRGPAFRGEHGFKFKMGGHGFGLGFPGLKAAAGDVAAFLGITPEQLREELTAEGASLATVAEAHGKSREDLKAFISAQAEEKFDAAVADGALSQERADEMLAELDEHLDDVIDHAGSFRPFRGAPGMPLWDHDDDSGGGERGRSGEFEESFRS